MQRIFAAALALVFVGVIIIGLLFIQGPTTAEAHLELLSDPFPLAVGRTTLIVRLTDANGRPIDGADVNVVGSARNSGTLPVVGTALGQSNGEYRFRLVWPMMGQWLVDVSATPPGTSEAVSDQYKVYVYSISPNLGTAQSAFKSVKESTEAISADPARELWIVIDQGTKAELTMGHDNIPLEIRLSVSGQNTLVIRNDDIAEHMVGPFFVRPGETIRQEFSEPAEFVGFCSISRTGSISIIVGS